jgi:hypothetical protein
MKKKKKTYLGHKRRIWHHLCPFSLSLPQPLLLSFVVVHVGVLLIERKKEEKKKRKDTNMVVKTGWQLC